MISPIDSPRIIKFEVAFEDMAARPSGLEIVWKRIGFVWDRGKL